MVSTSAIMDDAGALRTIESTERKAKRKRNVAKDQETEPHHADPPILEEEGRGHADNGRDADGEEGTGFGRAFLQILGKDSGGLSSGDAPILVKQHRAVAAAAEAEKAQLAGQQEAKKQRKELVELAHVLPASGPTPGERALLQVATRGVVRLFNAVAKAQKEQAAVAGGQDGHHKSKGGLDKRSFLAELRGVAGEREGATAAEQRPRDREAEGGGEEVVHNLGTNGVAGERQQQGAGVAERGASRASWDVLRDDFLLGRQKLADWDKETDDVAPAGFDDNDGGGDSISGGSDQDSESDEDESE